MGIGKRILFIELPETMGNGILCDNKHIIQILYGVELTGIYLNSEDFVCG